MNLVSNTDNAGASSKEIPYNFAVLKCSASRSFITGQQMFQKSLKIINNKILTIPRDSWWELNSERSWSRIWRGFKYLDPATKFLKSFNLNIYILHRSKHFTWPNFCYMFSLLAGYHQIRHNKMGFFCVLCLHCLIHFQGTFSQQKQKKCMSLWDIEIDKIWYMRLLNSWKIKHPKSRFIELFKSGPLALNKSDGRDQNLCS